MASEIKIPYDSAIDVATNEMFLRATINRNLERLLKNDAVLAKVADEYGADKVFSIETYREDKEYSRGDVVVYVEYGYRKRTIKNLYLLQSLIDENANEPEYEVTDGFIKDFSKSGWSNLNPFFSIFNAESGDDAINVSAFIETSLSDKFYAKHEDNLEYHRYGELTEDGLSSKILLNDFSNVSEFRDKLFWPYEVGKVDNSNCRGAYRKWGNGVIEYNLTFCLGDVVQRVQTISPDGTVADVDYIKANCLVPLSSSSFDNDDYFLDRQAYSIFNRVCSQDKHVVNGIPQTNVDKCVNVYHGTICFPIPFSDEQYMIFTSSTSDSDGKSQSPNTLTFLNRQKQSVTAMLAIPNYNEYEDVDRVLLKNNVFQCQIIGRWKPLEKNERT